MPTKQIQPTAKENAKQIVDKMKGYNFEDIQSNALVACDEVIDTLDNLIMVQPDSDGYTLGLIIFYKQVRIEIEKL